MELVSVVAIAAALLAAAALTVRPLVGTESGRSAVYTLQSMAQLARMEAVARNRECRLLLSEDLRRVVVTDTLGTTSDTSDDEVLHDSTLPEAVTFERPDAGSAVTWASLGGSPEWFQVRFASDGTVEAGEGEVVVRGGDHYGRIAVFPSGGSQVTKWDSTGWRATRF